MHWTWNFLYSIHDEDSSRINYEEVALFHSSLEEHVINTIGIDLSHSHLKTIAISGYVVIDVSGKVSHLIILSRKQPFFKINI